MIGTATLHELAVLADRLRWRVALVGDPRQLQAVGRGGLFTQVCATGRVVPLATIHRFTHRWEQAASVQLRHGHPAALDVYQQHGRVRAGTLNEHLNQLASKWIDHHRAAETVAITATSNAQVDAINDAVQRARQRRDEIGVGGGVEIAGGQHAYVGDVVVTRRNDRTLTTTCGDTVRNRDRWTVAATHPDGTITVTAESGRGQIRLPADYTVAHVRLGYAATEHGNQGVTVDVAYQLVSAATTRRGLYVGATRGRHSNQFHVNAADLTDAREILDAVVAIDRADIPATNGDR